MSDTKLQAQAIDDDSTPSEIDVKDDRDAKVCKCDPFEPREGYHLEWKDVNITVEKKADEGPKVHTILKDVWGHVPTNQTTAIMGSSGSGKTSLLNVLSGRATTRGNLTVSADIRINGYKVVPTDYDVRKNVAYVEQDDSLPITATPREAIRFSAKLRLDKSMQEEQLDKLTTHMLEELGLTHCADTIVGGALVKGISGGERKRASVGVELVTKPALVFLDEPTSGLDSFSAVQVCKVLKKLANAGSAVLFTIHQPSSEIFNSFDQLILLNKGRIMYQGPVDEVASFFKARDFEAPSNYNTADHIMSIAQSVPIDNLEKVGFFPKDEQLHEDPLPGSFLGSEGLADLGHVGFFVETKMLLLRELKNIPRNFHAVQARFAMTCVASLAVALLFLDVADSSYAVSGNVQSSFGALVMVGLVNILATAAPSLIQFPQERPIFIREYSTNHYSVLSYFFSRMTLEVIMTALQVLISCLVTYFAIGFDSSFAVYYSSLYILALSSNAMGIFVGSAVEDPHLATELLPALIMPQILFSGFVVLPDLIPVWLRWIRYLFPLTYTVRILLLEEFDGACSGLTPNYCESLIENVQADSDERWWYWLMLIVLFAVFRLAALVALRTKATKFY